MCPRPPEKKATDNANKLINVPTTVQADDHKPTGAMQGGEPSTAPPVQMDKTPQSSKAAQPTVHPPHWQPIITPQASTINKSINFTLTHKEAPTVHHHPPANTKGFAALRQNPKARPKGQTNFTWPRIILISVLLNYPGCKPRNDPLEQVSRRTCT